MVERDTPIGHAGGVPTIAELIRTQMTTTGRSYRQMADTAAAAGYPIRHQTLQILATSPPKQWPKTVDTIRAIASAVGVNERAIVLSFAHSFGLDVTRDASLLETMLPAGVSAIPPEVQASIAALVSAMVGSLTRAAAHTSSGAEYDPEAATRRTTARLHARSAEDVLSVINSETVTDELQDMSPDQLRRMATDMEARQRSSPSGDLRDVVFEDAIDAIPEPSVEESSEDRQGR